MRAIVLEQKDGRGHLTYTENRRIPEPKDDEIRVKVKSAGLNPVDYKLAGEMFRGRSSRYWGLMLPESWKAQVKMPDIILRKVTGFFTTAALQR